MSKVATRPYDAARYLRDEADVAAYLQVVIDGVDGDDQVILTALEEVARVRKLARDVGMTRAGLYRALSGEGCPSFETVTRILHATELQLAAKLLRGPC